MKLNQFVAELTERGVKLWAEGDQLRVRAAKGVLTPELRDELALHKAELVKLLHNNNATQRDADLPLLRVSRTGNLPVSFAQEGLWFLSQLEPTNPFYNEVLALRLQGTLNVVALEKSLNKIIQRHEILRTNFATVEGQPVQVIATSLTLSVPVVDLGELPDCEREIAWGLKARAQVQQPFDLSSSGLIQASVLQLTQTEHILLLTIHHIVWDAPSEGVLVKELAALYTAYCNDLLRELPELPIQYADFAVWQRQWLQGDVLESQLAYWKQQLSGAPALLELPTDRVRPLTQTFQGACYRQALSKELTEAMIISSQRLGVTLFMTLLAALQTLLYRYTGQSDICVGTPYAGRERPEIEGLIGLFVNTLVLRTDISGNPSFEELLFRVREVALGAYAHTDLPFEKLVEQLQPVRSLSYTPLCQVMFALFPPRPQIDLEGLTGSPVAVETATAKFDLNLAFFNTDKGLIGHWKYNTDLFDASTIARMAGHFQTLLEGIVANPQQKVSSVPLFTIQERHQLLIEWNNTTKVFPFDKCIHQLFEEQVKRSPDTEAVVFEGKQLTYLQLNQRANQLAHYLRTLGVGPEVLVGICVERSLEMVVSLLGILKAGGAYLPLDPALPQESLAFRLIDAQVPILLTHHGLLVREEAKVQTMLYLDADWELIAQESSANPNSEVIPENLAYVLYTSGSTGQPKGVAIEHRQILNYLHAILDKLQLPTGASFANVSTFAADLGNTVIFPALCTGGCLHIISQERATDPKALAEYFGHHPIDCLKIVPTHLASLLTSKASNSIIPRQCLVLGGEAASWDLIETIQQEAPNCRILNHYGPTETTVGVLTYPVSSKQASDNSKTVPIGRPIANTQVYILDRHQQPVPIGVPGELHIGGASLARGYLNRPDLTAEKFINPFNDKINTRLYKTGDLVRYLSDGNIEFLGRLDRQVKIRGFRIELSEVETAIAQHPAVRETVVVAREDIPGHKYLAAYIVCNQKEALTSSTLRDFLKEKLPSYMVPGAFVMLNALPLTPNGKVDHQALPIPDTASQELETTFVAARTWQEELLARIWCEVLHLQQVSIHDNFFELGGDSILSILIIAKAKQAGLQLTPKQIFQHQTIAELAAVGSTTGTRKAEQGPVTGSLPLTPIQHWFFAKNLPETHHYNQAFLLLVPPTLNPTLLQQAVQQLLVHHDALRLRFTKSEEGWQQFNALPDEAVPFSLVDLSALPETEQASAIETTSTQLQASLNLSCGPLVRVALYNLGTGKPSRLLLIIHHLAVDGVSWRILLENLQTAYQQLESGRSIQLPAKTTSFKHWAFKLTEYARSSVAKKELTYWQSLSRTQIARLPLDCSEGANTEASAHTVSVSLNIEETRALLQEVPKAYGTQINDVLLTALVQVLAAWSGSNSVLVELEGHGREEILSDVDLSRTVGWFTTRFPVLLQYKATNNPGDVIKFIKEQLGAVPNRGIGYGLLRYLSGDAEITSILQTLPMAEVSFNYLGQFDWGMQADSLFKLAPESVGPEGSLLGHRSYLLDINGIVVEGQLQLTWTYSENFHYSTTIESLAQDYACALRSLIAHCLSPSARSYTPDVSEQTIHSEAQHINSYQREEDNATVPLHLLELPENISELLPDDTEAAYPLAKMQEFMLYHYKNDPQKMGVYHGQKSYDIYDESLDLNAFKKALEILVQKHPVLRTVFITSNETPVVQVVKKSLSFSISEQDISHIKSDEQENYIDVVMKQDRQNLFNIENPNEPLFRFGIFRKAKNKFEFLMSVHHAIADGWGSSEFLNQLYELYLNLKKGEEITVIPDANVYKEFVALEKEILDSQDAADFWRLQLKNYVYKPLKPCQASVDEGEAVACEHIFNSEIISDLQKLCRKLKVSPKAIFLSTYLDLIGTLMKEKTLCVGTVSNGRTERLSDPFGALGLFWNMVPFCQSISSDKGVQIKNVQQSLIDMEPYVRYPLLQILADQEKTELFFATFNFVHFHNAKNSLVHTGLKVYGRRFYDLYNFPLNCTMEMLPFEGNAILYIKYDKTYFSRQEICSMIQNYIEMLKERIEES
ncbi:amino acid adenylation domain-containing protein [Phormidium sp. LEGE 05292]|uniref:non-ribosomal peptide synthetase n=1 Tax=[Phormidium] sp. LEGE 05292 TaxID=767427 RepID=UPI001880D4A4|nr:non-ribosomal peptide synthetase [Phormidium sp. LEGE 05292]MBE9228589.1 amino acid adenylation domain-containing protein [Phormidium sp. LEGE 05292]